jgi:siroheme synthase-like protein
MKTQLNPYFQVGLDVLDRPCLVIGGGAEAEEKSGRLLAAGANLSIVSPRLTTQLQSWADAGRLSYKSRVFNDTDLASATFLVLNTVNNDDDLTSRVYDLAQENKVLVNSYDNPAYSNFGMVALVAPGHLRLGISTSNASPALSSRLRRTFEGLFDAEFTHYLDRLASVRAYLKEKEPERAKRFRLLRALVAEFRFDGHLVYPPNWQTRLDALFTCDRINCDTTSRCSTCPLINS